MYTTKWRIYCQEPGDEGWQTVWWNMQPTNCPNSNDHAVNVYSVQEIANETEQIRLTDLNKTVATTNYTRVARAVYNTTILPPIRRIKGTLYCDGTTTSYDVKIVDSTNVTTLLEATLTNTDEETVALNIGTIDTPPSSEFVAEIYVKRNDGTGSVYVNELIVISE